MSELLQTILATKRQELSELRSLSLPTPPPRRRLAFKRRPGERLRILAEIKHRSPSAGALSTTLTVRERASVYERAGASVVSVLTDQRFFGGSFEHLAQAREATQLPILCKEFVIDEAQLRAARAFGADWVLLIVRCLPESALKALMDKAVSLDLEPLVEVSSESEAETAIRLGATLIGVNARDLNTLEMRPGLAQKILSELPPYLVRIHLSGVRSSDDVQRLAQEPIDGVLIGEALMRLDQPGPLLSEFAQAARGEFAPGAKVG